MKYLVVILTMLSMVAHAGDKCQTQVSAEEVQEQLVLSTVVPAHLKGATITVTLADGTSSTVPAERFKVVPRKQQYIVTKTSKSSVTKCSADQQRNRVSVIAGRGTKDGLDRDDSAAPSKVTVENKVGAVYGAQYQYKTDIELFKMPLSIGVQGQTNKTGSLLLGLDF